MPAVDTGIFAAIFSKFQVPSYLGTPKTLLCQTSLQRLADGLQECCDIDYPVKIILIPSDTANAIALAGDTIVIFSGIFDTIRSENGIAFVLAHELGHFKHRDHLQAMGSEHDFERFNAYCVSHPECEARIAALKKTIQDRHFDIRTVKPLPAVFNQFPLHNR